MANEPKQINTRIRLSFDTESRWASSQKQLQEGEVAVSYIKNENGTCSNFKFKVGRRQPPSTGGDARLLTWSEIPEDDQFLDVASIRAYCVSKSQYVQQMQGLLAAIDELDRRLTVVETRLNDRVTAYVRGNDLYLTEGEKPSDLN